MRDYNYSSPRSGISRQQRPPSEGEGEGSRKIKKEERKRKKKKEKKKGTKINE